MTTRAVVLVLGLAALAAAPSPLTVRDIDGRTWTPLAPAAGEVNLLVFVATDCPISRRYAPEVDRIAAQYRARHVQTFLIYADPPLDRTRVRANLEEFHSGLGAPAIVDTELRLTSATGVTVTPEVVVMTRAGRAYRGRIDDLYVSAGQSRRAAQHHDLREALDAVLAGKPVAPSETKAVGCFIEAKGRASAGVRAPRGVN
jgi:hypothetical protein